jgi:hypothetical protein
VIWCITVADHFHASANFLSRISCTARTATFYAIGFIARFDCRGRVEQLA